MSFVTKQQCLKQPDTHFVISGFTDSTNKALGRCLCPIGKQFDYENSKTCVTPSREPKLVEYWPLPLNNYSLEKSCRNGYESVSVDGIKACLGTKCPSNETLTRVNGIPRCVADGNKNDITYGYLQTNPCSRISSPIDLLDQDTIFLRKNGGYLTYFPEKCPNAPGVLPPTGDEYSISPIRYANVPSTITEPEPKKRFEWTEDERLWVVLSAVGFLILLWLVVLFQWIYRG
jgi:hypothetical protein